MTSVPTPGGASLRKKLSAMLMPRWNLLCRLLFLPVHIQKQRRMLNRGVHIT